MIKWMDCACDQLNELLDEVADTGKADSSHQESKQRINFTSLTCAARHLHVLL